MTDAADWGRYNLPALWAMIKDEKRLLRGGSGVVLEHFVTADP